ncbi:MULTISPECIES: hypothetical protein [Methylomonas]|uniref:hypothetical protein n=1 Tax=Methylomonas TaxID=416 RepID=UPI00123239D9|nr:hypothetical protein [Methylomonas rhizoryzae]
MNINTFSSVTNLISTTQQRANDAANTIARLPVDKQEVGTAEQFSSGDLFKPVLSLKEAELETSAAAKVIKSHEKTVGSLLDIKV